MARKVVAPEELGSSTHTFTDEHVLYSKLRPNLNKVALPDSGGWCTTELLPLKPDPARLDRGYLAHYLKSFEFVSWATSRTDGAKMPRVKMDELRAHRIPLPSLPEQQRIATLLDKADAIRRKRREALKLADEWLNSTFLEMFGDPVSNPNGWPRKSLGEITRKITDGEHLNPTFSQAGMAIVMAGNVLEDRVDLESAKFVSKDLGESFRRKCGPERGDVLVVSRGATIGRSCVVRTDLPFCLMGSVILVKPLKDIADSGFLSVLLKHPASRAALYKTSGSSAQQAIYIKDVKNMSVIVPPIDKQQEFANRASAVEKLKSSSGSAITEADTLFLSLQHDSFNGKLTPHDL